MDTVRLLIADDHAIVRMGLRALFEAEGGVEVVGEAEDGREAVEKTVRLKPDIVVMDLMMPVLDGIAATAEIRQLVPGTHVLALTTSTVSDELGRALAAGAEGAVLKTSANRELLKAVRSVARGRRYVSREIEDLLSADPPAPDLTPRQAEVLEAMTKGLTNKDIARELGIRPDVVNLHVIAILDKIGAANRTEAVAIALRKHLLRT